MFFIHGLGLNESYEICLSYPGTSKKMDRKAKAKFSNFFSVKKFAKMAIKFFVAMPNSKLHMNFRSISSFLWPGQALEFTTVIEAKRQKVGPDREFLG